MEQSSPKEYGFDKKIKYVENLLRKTIKEERHRLKKVFKSNKTNKPTEKNILP